MCYKMNNIVLCDPFYAYLKVGKQYLDFEKWCKDNAIKKTKFKCICKNSYVRLIIIGNTNDIRKFAVDCNYNIIDLYYSTKLNDYKQGLKILDKHMNN